MTTEQFDALFALIATLIVDHHLDRHGVRSERDVQITQGVIDKARTLLVTKD